MNNSNQIILGAGGSIGRCLAKELKHYNATVSLYGRNPEKINEDDIIIRGNLLDKEQTVQALAGMDIAYLVVGLPYKTATWQKDWPVIMENVLQACITHKVRLVFFDNVYMYDPAFFSNLTEDTPLKPVSGKGVVRASIASMVTDAIARGRIQALIARSADFYGPGNNQSMFNEMVIKKILQGKKPNWFLNMDKKHALTLVEDAARATALLGNTDAAYNQVWHLPTDKALTASQLIGMVNSISGHSAKVLLTSKSMARLLGYFIPIVKESREILYQYDRDYVFNSSKFEHSFGLKATPIRDGIKKTIRAFESINNL